MTARNATPPAEPIVVPSPALPAAASSTDEMFHINDEKSANWYLRKLANLAGEQQRVQMQAAQIVAQLEADADGLKRLYEGELKEYVRRTLSAGGNRRRSITLLQGTCAFRTIPAGFRIYDNAAALDHAMAHVPDAVDTICVLSPVAYRRVVEETGEILPGIETTPERESFSIRFGKTD